MFVEKVKTPGLAHLSWVVGDGAHAAVIDPRRDFDIYLDIARRHDAQISRVLETHRNEDLVSGAPLLGERTGARVLHGPHADDDIAYADTVTEGDTVQLGKLTLKVMETPGHTDDSISIVLYDEEQGGEAVGVFTGDTLFVGDVGRTDFYPDRPRQVAGALHDSLQRLMELGDQTIIYPAHGAGSVCGSGMASREFSTIGRERECNPMLQVETRQRFIELKTREQHYQPPYFRHMEKLNSKGNAGPAPGFEALSPCDADTLSERVKMGATIVDVRDPAAWCGAHVPRAICLPLDLITAYAGWFFKPEQELVLVAEDLDQAREAERHLTRIGMDNVHHAWVDGMATWAAGGHDFSHTQVISADTVRRRLESGQTNWTLLDVRKEDEWDSGAIDGATHCYLGHLPERIADFHRDRFYTLLCGSGKRAAVAASLLRHEGFNDVDVFLGSMGAWRHV